MGRARPVQSWAVSADVAVLDPLLSSVVGTNVVVAGDVVGTGVGCVGERWMLNVCCVGCVVDVVVS